MRKSQDHRTMPTYLSCLWMEPVIPKSKPEQDARTKSCFLMAFTDNEES